MEFLSIEIDAGKGRKGLIVIHEGDVPFDLAKEFAKLHNLKESSILVLEKHISDAINDYRKSGSSILPSDNQFSSVDERQNRPTIMTSPISECQSPIGAFSQYNTLGVAEISSRLDKRIAENSTLAIALEEKTAALQEVARQLSDAQITIAQGKATITKLTTEHENVRVALEKKCLWTATQLKEREATTQSRESFYKSEQDAMLLKLTAETASNEEMLKRLDDSAAEICVLKRHESECNQELQGLAKQLELQLRENQRVELTCATQLQDLTTKHTAALMEFSQEHNHTKELLADAELTLLSLQAQMQNCQESLNINADDKACHLDNQLDDVKKDEELRHLIETCKTKDEEIELSKQLIHKLQINLQEAQAKSDQNGAELIAKFQELELEYSQFQQLTRQLEESQVKISHLEGKIAESAKSALANEDHLFVTGDVKNHPSIDSFNAMQQQVDEMKAENNRLSSELEALHSNTTIALQEGEVELHLSRADYQTLQQELSNSLVEVASLRASLHSLKNEAAAPAPVHSSELWNETTDEFSASLTAMCGKLHSQMDQNQSLNSLLEEKSVEIVSLERKIEELQSEAFSPSARQALATELSDCQYTFTRLANQWNDKEAVLLASEAQLKADKETISTRLSSQVKMNIELARSMRRLLEKSAVDDAKHGADIKSYKSQLATAAAALASVAQREADWRTQEDALLTRLKNQSQDFHSQMEACAEDHTHKLSTALSCHDSALRSATQTHAVTVTELTTRAEQLSTDLQSSKQAWSEKESALSASLALTRSQYDALRSSKDQLSSEVQRLSSSLSHTQEVLKSLQQAWNEKESAMTAAVAQHKSILNSSQAAWSEQLQQLEEKSKAMTQSALQEAHRKELALGLSLSRAEERVRHMEEAMAALVKDSQKQQQDMQGKEVTMAALLAMTTKQHSVHLSEMDETRLQLTTQAKQFDDQLSNLKLLHQEQLSSVQVELAVSKESNVQLSECIRGLEGANSTAAKSIADLKAQNISLGKNLRKLMNPHIEQ